MSFYYEHATKEYTGYFLEPLFWSSYAHSCLTGTFIQLKVEYKLLSRSLLFVEALTGPQSFFLFGAVYCTVATTLYCEQPMRLPGASLLIDRY